MKALAASIGFCAGITILSLVPLGWFVVSFLLLLTCACFIISRVRTSSTFLVATIVLLAATLGAARAELAHDELPPSFVVLLDTPVTLEGKVVADPDVRETTARLTLAVEERGEHTKVLAVVPLFPHVRYGESVRVHGTLKTPEPFETNSDRTFRYDRFLAKDGIFALVSDASLEVIAPRTGLIDSVRGFFSDMKFAGIDALSVALPEPEASLAAGLVLGGKQGLGDRLLDDFIRVGLVHIVVLSGYNVMIVAEAVFRAFSFASIRIAAPLAAAVIFGFVLAAGAGAASIRAGIMAGVALFGRATKRRYDAFRALVAAGILMLFWNPLLLMNDPGFQLSFVATLGLIFGSPITERWFHRVRPAFLREVVATTIAAQISVLPLLLYQNGLFSLVSLPANVLVLPFVPLAMAASAFAGFVGFVAPLLAPVAGLPAYALLFLIVRVVEFAAHVPLAAITIPAFPFSVVILSYGFLMWYVSQKEKIKRPA